MKKEKCNGMLCEGGFYREGPNIGKPCKPKEVEVVVGTKEEELWQRVKDTAEDRLLNMKIEKAMLEHDLKLVEVKLKNLKPIKVPLN